MHGQCLCVLPRLFVPAVISYFFLLDEFCQELPVHLCRSPFCTLGETNLDIGGGCPWTKIQKLPSSFLQKYTPYGSSMEVPEETKSTLSWLAGSCYLPCPLLSGSWTPQLMFAPSLHTPCRSLAGMELISVPVQKIPVMCPVLDCWPKWCWLHTSIFPTAEQC